MLIYCLSVMYICFYHETSETFIDHWVLKSVYEQVPDTDDDSCRGRLQAFLWSMSIRGCHFIHFKFWVIVLHYSLILGVQTKHKLDPCYTFPLSINSFRVKHSRCIFGHSSEVKFFQLCPVHLNGRHIYDLLWNVLANKFSSGLLEKMATTICITFRILPQGGASAFCLMFRGVQGSQGNSPLVSTIGLP